MRNAFVVALWLGVIALYVLDPLGVDDPPAGITPSTHSPVPSTLQECIDKMPDPGHPVTVLLLDMGADWGSSTWDGEKFIIRVHRDAEYTVLIDVLIHEWAHTLVWDAATEDDHGPLFGVAFARCYRALHGE